jgi:hypothetical protein
MKRIERINWGISFLHTLMKVIQKPRKTGFGLTTPTE